MMKMNFTIRLAGMSIAAMTAFTTAHGELVRNPTAVGTSIDVGQIVKGTLYDGSNFPGSFKGDDQVITRTGVYLTESGVYNSRLTINLTIGGLFWFSLPETQSFQTRRIQFGPGVGQAQGVYAFGDVEKPAAKLQFGLFPHKYSDSKNLGEYLFRSGTYPGVLTSGGWSYINAAAYLAQGARLTVPMFGGKVTHDLMLYMERDLEPAHDISPAYILKLAPWPFLELSGGAVWSHGLSLNSKRLAPKVNENAYSKITNKPIFGAQDSATVNTPVNQLGYYTFEGVKVMGTAALDFGAMIGSESIEPGEFKLYTEVALLGVKDQPFYYEKKSERMPMMVGINLPTFGLLDGLSLEIEYHKSSFPNTNGSVLQGQLPIPVNNGENPYVYDPTDPRYLDTTNADFGQKLTPDELITKMKEDDWKWSVHARRSLSKGVSLYAQAASDHLRHFNFTATPAALPASSRPGQWYYVLRLEFGI